MKSKQILVATMVGIAMVASGSAMAATGKAKKVAKTNDEVQKIIYTCKGNKNLDVVYINTAKSSYAMITQSDEIIPLEIFPMASGANYKSMDKNYTYQLLTKGKSATLEADGKAIYEDCTIAN